MGVVPAIKPAARLTANGIVGLLATRGTVKRPYTRELIERFANECQIAMLVPRSWWKWRKRSCTARRSRLKSCAAFCVHGCGCQEPPDTVVLGCTHFPLLQEELLKVLPEGTRLVDFGGDARWIGLVVEHRCRMRNPLMRTSLFVWR
ncbi:hypothetical protein ACVXG7_17080 [Enterobacter hormaechei]